MNNLNTNSDKLSKNNNHRSKLSMVITKLRLIETHLIKLDLLKEKTEFESKYLKPSQKIYDRLYSSEKNKLTKDEMIWLNKTWKKVTKLYPHIMPLHTCVDDII